MKDNFLLDRLSQLIEPIVLELNYELYHIEYVREQNENYLRVYIDKPEGIFLEDCEKVSRRISDVLDETDPVEDAYYLEVSSPGIERILYNDNHLAKYIHNNVVIKLSKLFNGSRKFEGELLEFNDNSIIIKNEISNIDIPRDRVKKIILKGEF